MDAQSFTAFLKDASAALDGLGGFGKEASSLREIVGFVNRPFNLAVVGRMKAGKSTLINGMIGQSLAISDVKEATATLNWICHGSAAQATQFVVEWKDGRSEPLPLTELKNWTGKSLEVLDRVGATRFLRLYSESKVLEEVQIVDTPGTGSAVEEHETARDFLRPDAISESIEAGGKADAIVYVLPPVGRERDKETLEVFSSSRLPNSGPYNSVAVLHKWDHLELQESSGSASPRSQAEEMAKKLQLQLGDLVARTVVVSGPLALAARSAPDSFFNGLTAVVRDQETDIVKALRKDERWDADETRRNLRKQHQMPWSSFGILVRMALHEQITTGFTLRARCLDESGITELEAFLRERFFSQQAIIKQCQLLGHADRVLDPALRQIGALSRQAKQESLLAERAQTLLARLDPCASAWCAEKALNLARKADALQFFAVDCDRKWQTLRSDIEHLQFDLRVGEELDKRPDLFPAEDHELLRSMCNHLVNIKNRKTLGQAKMPSLQEVEKLINRYRSKENLARNRDRALLSHVVTRLEEVHSTLLQ
jgi:hypothetical protein